MRIAVVRCSDVRKEYERKEITELCRILEEQGAEVKTGKYIFCESEGGRKCLQEPRCRPFGKLKRL